MLSSRLRSFSFSLPSADVQSPSSRSCTFRVGPDVIGTSYWQAVKAREQRPIATPTTRSQAKFDELTEFCSPLEIGLRRIDEVWNALNVVAIGDSHLLFSFFEPRRDRITPS